MIVAAERAAVQVPRLAAVVRRPGLQVAPLRRPADMDPCRRPGLVFNATVAASCPVIHARAWREIVLSPSLVNAEEWLHGPTRRLTSHPLVLSWAY